MFTYEEQRFIGLAHITGFQDCANTFDGDVVPTVEELSETAEDMRRAALEEGCSSEAADAAAAEWISAYREKAARLVAHWKEIYAADADD